VYHGSMWGLHTPRSWSYLSHWAVRLTRAGGCHADSSLPDGRCVAELLDRLRDHAVFQADLEVPAAGLGDVANGVLVAVVRMALWRKWDVSPGNRDELRSGGRRRSVARALGSALRGMSLAST
jgi:hypothetical protein